MENKDIKDYLHLYLGCELEAKGNGSRMTLLGVVGNSAHFKINGVWYSGDIDGYKPILRPLSDMTEEEWVKCFELSRGLVDQHFSGKISRMAATEVMFILGAAQFIFGIHYCCDNDVRIGSGICFYQKRYLVKEVLSISSEGMQSHESHFNDEVVEQVLNINHIFTYLLKQGFDLFGLIEAGLAIDKTKIEHNGK